MATKSDKAADAVKADSYELSKKEKQQRKQHVLTHGSPSITQSISNAVVLKNDNLFFLTEANGMVPLGGKHGFGLYYRDCRYLNGYSLTMGRKAPNVLVSNASQGFRSVTELTNPELNQDNHQRVPMSAVGVKWERTIDAENSRLFESMTFKNYSGETVRLPLELTFEAGFEDVFAIRGLLKKYPGAVRAPEWRDDDLVFLYEGADNRYRSLIIQFDPNPHSQDGACAQYLLEIGPHQEQTLSLSFNVTETPNRETALHCKYKEPELDRIESYFQLNADQWLRDTTMMQSDSLVLNTLLERSLRDLRVLRTSLDGEQYFAAGVPWFVALFGRDSLITALQTLAFQPTIAADTLRLLAKYQGQEVNEYKDEQPGKILHELRIGELARLGAIPHTPYYGTIDATPLFLYTLAQHAAWTGDLQLFDELRENVQRALDWIDKYGDLDDDGYVEYASNKQRGLVNQGWKDSGDAIRNADGSLAEPPIALVEVQAYVYQAWRSMAALYARSGEQGRADELNQKADDLRQRFNRDFWSEELDFYVLALEKDNHPTQVVTSNPGHALWMEIVPEEKAERTKDVLMSNPMFNGWGVRTLSSDARAYNPTGYHLGTVWPHDNSLIAAGFRQYGFDEAAQRILDGLVHAAMDFDLYRLPELIAGFHKLEYNVPVRYPVACHPQAWAAGSIPFLMHTFLGLKAEAFDGRLRIVRPMLPQFIDRLDVRGLKVGQSEVDLYFERRKDRVQVDVKGIKGEIEVKVEQ